MNTTPELERAFPLSVGPEPRRALRPPRLAALVPMLPAAALEPRAFQRPWVAPRTAVEPPHFGRTWSAPCFTP